MSEQAEFAITEIEPFTEEEMFELIRHAISEPGSFLPREADESVSNWSARAVTAVMDEDARNRAAARIADETKIEAMNFRNGMKMELQPAQAIAARTVAAARTLLGDAPNYSETPVEMTTKLAGETEKYAFIVQWIAPGKLTPHEARQAAEKRAERAEARLACVRADCEAMTTEQHPADTDHKIWLKGVYAQAKRVLNILDAPAGGEGQ